MKKIQFLYVALFFAAITGCKTLDTNLSIKKKELPPTYSGSADTACMSATAWNLFFSDTLLIRLIDTALVYNSDLGMALQRIEAERANLRFAKGSQYPQVGIGVTAGISKPGRYTSDGAGNASTEMTPGNTVPTNLPNLGIGLQASWEIDIWGKLRNKRKAALSRYLASIEGTRFVVSSLVTDIADAYYELMALDTSLAITRQSVARQQEALNVVMLQKQAGQVTELAVQQFKAQLLSVQAMEKDYLQQIREAENRINFLCGVFPREVRRDEGQLSKPLPEIVKSGIPPQLLTNRPDIREAENMLAATRFDLKSARAAFFPTLSITAGAGYEAFNPSYLFLSPASLAYSVVGNLFSPLLNMSALKSQFGSAKASQLAAMYNYQKTILTGFYEVSDGLSALEKNREITSLKEEQSKTLAGSIESSTELYRSGRATYLEVLFAQQNYLQSQLDLVESRKEGRVSLVNLYKALGGGWK